MTTTLLLALALAQTSVSFRKEPPRAGERWVQTDSLAASLTVSFGSKERPDEVPPEFRSGLEKKDRETCLLEIEALDATGKLALTYREKGSFHRAPVLGDIEKKSPVAGKTYHVGAGAGEPRVTRPDGRAAPEREAAIVARDAAGIGALAAVLPDRPMREGESLAMDAAAARRLLGDLADTQDGGAVESMTLTLRGAAAEGARFDVAIRFAGLRLVDDRPLRTTAELKGEALVAPESGRLVRLTAEGTFRLAAPPDEEGLEITGAGSLRIERAVRAAVR
jgi:hypothetical protein